MMNNHRDELIKNIGMARYNHTLRVVNIAVELAKKHGVDIEKAKTAAYYHDCAKYKSETILLKRAECFGIMKSNIMRKNTELIHAPLSAKVAEKDYRIKDKEVLSAIKTHTTGRVNMSELDKVIYLADYIEPNRSFPGVNMARKLAFEDLDRAMLFALENTIKFLIEKKQLIAVETLETRNKLLEKLNME